MRTSHFLLLMACSVACGTTPTIKNPESFGTISVTLSDAFEGGTSGSGHPHYFSASLFPNPSVAVGSCVGATVTAGSCCYTQAVPPPSPTDGGPAGTTPDGGPDFVMLNAGTLALFDVTTNVAVDSLSYMQLVAGFGWAEGYPFDDVGVNGWSSGDVLRVNVPDSPLGSAFSAQVPALSTPDTTGPATIPLANALVLSWTPNANASTMTVSLAAQSVDGVGHGTVTCAVADSAGTVTVDTTLVAAFHSGDSCAGSLTRSSSVVTNVTGGSVTIVSQAIASFSATLD